MRKEIFTLDASKSTGGDLPVKILKLSCSEIESPLTACFNAMIDSCILPEELHYADVVPVFKNKGDRTD